MIIPQKVEMGINYKNIEHFKSKGYKNLKCKTNILVEVSDLPSNSHKMIKIQCDYCGKIFNRVYRDQIKFTNKSVIKKDACLDCRGQKTKESNLINYGVDSIALLETVKQKKKQTNLEKYGVEYGLSSPDIQNKVAQTNLRKYGTKNVFANKDIIKKIRKTNLKKYGFEYAIMSPEIKEKAVRKYVKTLYENKTAPTSREQQYLYDVLGGELNYPIDKLMLDIAFPNEKIYIEYQGSGHNLDVKMGKLTENEFFQKELKRYYFLKNKGWKMIEIISNRDYIPSKVETKRLFNFAKDILKEHNYIGFNIDDNKVKYNDLNIPYVFNELISYSQLRKYYLNNTYKDII